MSNEFYSEGMSDIEARMRALLNQYKAKYESRRQSLRTMKPINLRALARNYGLPEDLNTSEMIKYILEKEFSPR